ncbi:hypothetical protein [Phaeodactylibacter xiamenensis]|uniref:hypothetical protein n=1 Tax=Phaeodactylibacter xiamenensis TaxID=1524460 RepID=UPI003CCBF93A
MKQSFTSNHLVRYLYNEVTVSERLGLEEALTRDFGLFEGYSELKAAYRALPKVTFSPSKQSLQRVLEYSSERAALERSH